MSDSDNIVDFQVQSASDGAEEHEELEATGSSDNYDDTEQNNGAEAASETENPDAANDTNDEDGAETDGAEEDDDENEGEDSENEVESGHSILHGVLGNKTLEDVIEREAKEEQDTTSPFSLSRTLGGVMISRFVQRQMGVVLIIVAFLIIYISLRYMCQQKLVRINRIEKQIDMARYKATVCSSELTEKSRESSVLKRLPECGDRGLTISNEPPYLIRIEEK